MLKKISTKLLSLSHSYDPAEQNVVARSKSDEIAALRLQLADLQKQLENREYARTDEESAFIEAVDDSDRNFSK